MSKKIQITYRGKAILSELIKDGGFMTTAEVASESGVSWNTALGYLKSFHRKGWVEKRGNKTLYWKAIIDDFFD